VNLPGFSPGLFFDNQIGMGGWSVGVPGLNGPERETRGCYRAAA
jgi:hypothetical protein